MSKLEIEGFFGFSENGIDPYFPKPIGYSSQPNSEFEEYLSFNMLQFLEDMWNNEEVSGNKKLRITIEELE